MAEDSSRNCFVMMPFGRRVSPSGAEIDFDLFYEKVIEKAVMELGFTPVRSDKLHTGSVHGDMFAHIAEDEVAIADITTGNPNVLYELGVRHALRESITVVLQKHSEPVPFNINDVRVIRYSGEPDDHEATREEIKTAITAGLLSDRGGLEVDDGDSPISPVHRRAARDPRPMRDIEEHCFHLKVRPQKCICVITGDLLEHRGIDVWVNSENTNMQMARYYERSLSASIRFCGAVKDDGQHVVDDVIARELWDKKMELWGKGEGEIRERPVEPATVWVTGSGELYKDNGVKKVFHTAAVRGAPGTGYEVVPNVERCVRNALRRMDEERKTDNSLRTIIIPMLGTGMGGGDVRTIAPRLIREAIAYLRSHEESGIETVYFSAWSRRDLNVCLAALGKSTAVQRIPS